MQPVQKIFGLLSVALTLASPLALATPVRYYDVNTDTSPTQAGWTAVNLSGINGVTFTSIGNGFIDHRDRDALNTDGVGGDVGNNDMWRDFIFADERFPVSVTQNPAVVDPAGLDIAISGLVANGLYAVELWAFDAVSSELRTALWNGVSYSFQASEADPTSLSDHVVRFNVLADNSGVALLQGRTDFANRGPCCNVFVNGFSLQQVPEPGSLTLACIGIAGMVSRRARRSSSALG